MRLQSLRWRRPSPALAISLVALFVSLGGVGYAAIRIPHNSVGTAQLRNGAVTNVKIRQNAVSSGKIRPNAIGRVRANLTQIQARVSRRCGANTAISAIGQQGVPTCASTLPTVSQTTILRGLNFTESGTGGNTAAVMGTLDHYCAAAIAPRTTE